MIIIKNKKKIDEMINKASNIFIVGHRYLDLDAIASNIGMYEYVKSFGKKPIIIINDKYKEAGVKRVIEKISDCYHIEKGSKVKYRINENSLLIITDTNKEMLLQDSSLPGLFGDNIIIIDHHEYNETSIQKGLIVVDDKLSSASEMITYLLESIDRDIDKKIATVLLSGIVLDTNNFALKTTADTYKAAYLLAKRGADSKIVQEILKQDIKAYIERHKMITEVKIYDKIAIACAKASLIYRREDLAKVSDLLLQFNGIEASFAVGKLDTKKVGVSGRSTGNINIGDVLEYLGGGGNAYEAAAQVEHKKIKEVEEDIKEALKNFK
jgi:c-di-AMP phosphodiesterase-like protein